MDLRSESPLMSQNDRNHDAVSRQNPTAGAPASSLLNSTSMLPSLATSGPMFQTPYPIGIPTIEHSSPSPSIVDQDAATLLNKSPSACSHPTPPSSKQSQSEHEPSSSGLGNRKSSPSSYGTLDASPTPQMSSAKVIAMANASTPLLGPKALFPNENDVEDPKLAGDPKVQQKLEREDLKKHMVYMFPAFAIGLFLAAADQTIIVSTYGTIGTEFNALNKTSWIATGYYLTLASFQPLYGKMSDIFSRKSCLLFAYTSFGLGCLLCGLAPNINFLIAARALAGVGGGGMTVVVSILLSDAVSLKERGTWQSYVQMVFAIGAGAGAPLGGLLADTIGWRWMFLAQVPMCLIAFMAVAFGLKTPPKNSTRWKEKLKRIDFMGIFVLITAIFCLLLGLDNGSNVSWTEKTAIFPLCVSFLLFGLFITIETKVAAEPFLPGKIIFKRSLVAAYFCHFCLFAAWTGTLFCFPLYLQAVLGQSATQSGLLMLSCIAAAVTGSISGGLYLRKRGRYFWLLVTAYCLLVVGMMVITLSSGLVIRSLPVMVLGMFTSGLGYGIGEFRILKYKSACDPGVLTSYLGVVTTLVVLLSNTQQEDQAVVTACMYLCTSLGGVAGVSLASAATNQTLRAQLWVRLGHGPQVEDILLQVRRSLQFVNHLDTRTRDIVRHCYALSSRTAFILETVLAICTVVAVWGIKEKPLSGR